MLSFNGFQAHPHARIQKILSEGSKFDNFILVDEGWENQNTAVSGPSSASQRNAILRNSIFLLFSGGPGSGPSVPPEGFEHDPHCAKCELCTWGVDITLDISML